MRQSRNKAADIRGHRAEQMRILTSDAVNILAECFTQILNTKSVPTNIKSSYKIPITKKGKDSRIQDNHRKITISDIFIKLLEKICMQHGKEDITRDNSALQCGFTEGMSPIMATLLLTEAKQRQRTRNNTFIWHP